ncbi:MAG TPA: response regulator, partial [Aggregatilineales bacterium]|nr:response regulator [Aggregatilineales bacterium]
ENDYILIVEPDADLLRSFTAYFDSAAEFKYYTASTGKETLASALQYRPKVIVLETQLPDTSGLMVFRELQLYPRTTHIPVIFLAGGREVLLQKQILEAGAHDFVQKPIDTAELMLRIRNTLRHIAQHVHPDTRLPGGKLVQEAIARMTQAGKSFYYIRVTIKDFDTLRDLHGFITAREVIIFAASVLSDVISEYGTAEDYLGHENDEVFAVITTPARGSAIEEQIKTRLESTLPQFYNFMERDQGYVEVPDESNDSGEIIRKPLMSVQTDVTKSEE